MAITGIHKNTFLRDKIDAGCYDITVEKVETTKI